MPKQTTHNFGRWIRFYIGAVDDLKLAEISDAAYRTWTHLLCVAGANDGQLPNILGIAHRVRLTEKEARKRVAELVEARLIDETPTGFVPHDWDDRQFVSDNGAARMRRYRERHKSVTRDDAVT